MARCDLSCARKSSGIWRAASFLGLGVALIGVGLFYQRVVFRKESTAE